MPPRREIRRNEVGSTTNPEHEVQQREPVLGAQALQQLEASIAQIVARTVEAEFTRRGVVAPPPSPPPQEEPAPVPQQEVRQEVQYEDRLQDVTQRFQKQKPKRFSGGLNPQEAEDWLEHTEWLFEYIQAPEADKVRLASFQLEGNALRWWKSIRDTATGRVVSWEEFVRKFHAEYLPLSVQNQKKTEFMQLTQGSRTVREYALEFTNLSRFAPEVVATEPLKVWKFQHGLRPSLRSRVELFELSNYEAAVEKAVVAEKGLEEAKEARLAQSSGQSSKNRKRNRDEGGQSQPQRGPVTQKTSFIAQSGASAGSSGARGPQIICRGCGLKGHYQRECRWKDYKCRACGQMGHLQRNCKAGSQSTVAGPARQFGRPQWSGATSKAPQGQVSQASRGNQGMQQGARPPGQWGAAGRGS